MKLSGAVFTNPGVQSLGREDVRGPLRVASAKASAASKGLAAAKAQAQSARTVANDAASIAQINLRTANSQARFAERKIDANQQFGRDMLRLADRGMGLTANIVKASATRDFQDAKTQLAFMQEGINNSPSVTNEDQGMMGTRVVDASGGIVPAYNEQAAKLKEDMLKNANPWSRNLLEQMIDDEIDVGRLNMTKLANDRAEDLAFQKVDVTIQEQLDANDFKGAGITIDTNSDMLVKKGPYSAYKKGLIAAKDKYDDKQIAFKVSQQIIGVGGSLAEQIAEANLIKDPDQRDMVKDNITYNNNIVNQSVNNARTRSAQYRADFAGEQMQAYYAGDLDPAEMYAPTGSSAAAVQALEEFKQRASRGDTIVTDRKQLTRLRRLAGESPETLKYENPDEWTAYLDEGHWNEMSKKWAAAFSGSSDVSGASGSGGIKMSRITSIGNRHQDMLGIRTDAEQSNWYEIESLVTDEVYAQPDKDWTDTEIDQLYRDATGKFNNKRLYQLGDTDNDEYIKGYTIKRGISIGPESFSNERDRFTQWAGDIQPMYKQKYGRDATPDELRRAWENKN